MNGRPRVVVGISGASGAAFGVRIVELLVESRQCEVHLVVTRSAERTLLHELGPDALTSISTMATHHHSNDNIGANIASGSFHTVGMIVAPCSIRTLSAIAASAADSLLVRAADVQLKERRRLVLMVRESPLHLGHLRAMTAVTECGAIVAPPVPALYHKPASIADIIDHVARRAIDLLPIDIGTSTREWNS